MALFTILHISDLHRSHREPLHNHALLGSLVADADRYLGENPAVPLPEAVIVSGDIIQGARLGDLNHATDVAAQYEVAEEFLGMLVERFLSGDRSQIVIVPGNHDVSWNIALASMRRLPKSETPNDILAALNEPGSPYRWSWDHRALYRIEDHDLYARRLDGYWNFVERFYSGVALPLPFNRGRGFNLFELDEGRIAVAAFESIDGNDCFAYQGALIPDAVAGCSLTLRDLGRPHVLRMGVWHHSVQGPPRSGDYMNVESVYEMAGHGFRLGVHGHQHVAAAAAYYVHLPEREAMGVVSAGSLCAGARELPRGVNRQYNLLVIEDDHRSARVHVREMAEGNHFTRKSNEGFQGGFVRLSWTSDTDAGGREVEPEQEVARLHTLAAEKTLAEGRAEEALSILKGIQSPNEPYARRLLFEAAEKAQDWASIAGIAGGPQSPSELISVVEALIQIGEPDRASSVLSDRRDLGLDTSTMRALEERIAARKLMRR